MFKKFLRALNQHLEEYLIALFLIAITFVMLLQIVMRYVFQHSLSWPEEFSRYCFVYITFLTFGYCIQHDSMLRLDIIKEVLPKKAWDVLQVIVILISAAFFLIISFSSSDRRCSNAASQTDETACSSTDTPEAANCLSFSNSRS